MPDVVKCVILDERVAGYLRLAWHSKAQQVACLHPGTAVLNLASAVCAKLITRVIWLLLLTADRPAELIGMEKTRPLTNRTSIKTLLKPLTTCANDIENGSETVANTCKTAIHKLFEGGKGPVLIFN